MKKELFNTLSMRFSAYNEVYRETDNLEWKALNKEYMIKTWKEICEHEDIKKIKHIHFNSNETDVENMRTLINIASREL